MKYRVVDDSGAVRAEGEIADTGLAALLRDTPSSWKVITTPGGEGDSDLVRQLAELKGLISQAQGRRGVTFVVDLGLDRAMEKLLSKMDGGQEPPPNFSGGMGWKP